MRDVNDPNAVEIPATVEEAVLAFLVAVRALSEHHFEVGEAVGATVEEISQVLDLRTRTIRRAIERLRSLDLIEEPIEGRYRSIRFADDGVARPQRPRRHAGRP
jgi:hypothetical protein